MASDKEIETWLNDHQGVVAAPQPAPKAPADSDIEAWLNSPTSSPASNVLDATKQALLNQGPQAKEAVTGGLSSAPDMASRITNFVQNKPNPAANTLLQLASNRPDITAMASTAAIPGTGLLPIAARTAASMAASATNPNTTKQDVGITGGLQTLLEALPYGASAVAPGIKAIMSKLSGVDSKAIQQLFDNPSLLFTGPSKAEAQQLFSSVAARAGLSPEVSDNVLFASGKRFVKNVLSGLQNEPTSVPTQTLMDAKQALDDLISKASRAGEDQQVKGFMQRQQLIRKELESRSPQLLGVPQDPSFSSPTEVPTFKTANKAYNQAMNRNQFLNIVPTNAAGDPSPMKALTAEYLLGLPLAGASLPAAQGLATSAAGAIAKAPNASRTSLQILRQYIQNQRQQGPH